MFSALKDALLQRRHSDEQKAAKRYQTLLTEALADKLTAKDADRVDEVLRSVGRQLPDFERDIQSLRECRQLEEVAAKLPGLEKQLRDLQAHHTRMTEEFQQWKKLKANELDGIYDQIISLSSTIGQAQDAKQQLATRFPGQSRIGADVQEQGRVENVTGQIQWHTAERGRVQASLDQAEKVLDELKEREAKGHKHLANRIANQQSVCDSYAREVAKADSKIAALREQLGESADTREPVAV